MGTLTGPRGLVVACVTDRRLLWSAVSAPAERSSLDANTRDLQLTEVSQGKRRGALMSIPTSDVIESEWF